MPVTETACGEAEAFLLAKLPTAALASRVRDSPGTRPDSVADAVWMLAITLPS